MPGDINTSGDITLGKLQNRWITKTGSSLIFFTRSFHHITGVTFFFTVSIFVMYCDKENVNILSALLIGYGVSDVVVCPGSRNAPIVHNFSLIPEFRCHSVVDERSAGFMALGLTVAHSKPVAVCVTSGSALLNVLPAAAEASYQHHGIIVISADRPQSWIDQLDGQTIPQQGALGSFVAKSVSLPEPTDDTSRWHCRRLVCEAMMELQRTGRSVHINVPITEPLFSFTTQCLPELQHIVYTTCYDDVINAFLCAERPMIVVGQLTASAMQITTALHEVKFNVVVIAESLSHTVSSFGNADAALCNIGQITVDYSPDFILYIGDHLVSKRIKKMLRDQSDVPLWHVAETPELRDVSMHSVGLLHVNDLFSFIHTLCKSVKGSGAIDINFAQRWNALLSDTTSTQQTLAVQYSQALAVKRFESQISCENDCMVFYANSSAVRLANIFATRRVECNRGINGIEGSLSTAVGAALSGVCSRVYCVIGDLSFFYDINALSVNGDISNLRILLLNNQCGGIFYQLPGLEQSSSRDAYVAASHDKTAKDICHHFAVDYSVATDESSLIKGIEWLTAQGKGPRLLEVMTDPNTDTAEYKKLFLPVG